jgi:hypothetical protein
MKRAAALAVLTALLTWGGEAQARGHHHHRARVSVRVSVPTATGMTLAQDAAVAYWGGQPCGGQVAIAYAPSSQAPTNDTGGVAVAQLWAWASTCLVTFNSDAFSLHTQVADFPEFCALVVHEYGHLFGHPDQASDPPASITYPFIGPLNEGVAPCVSRYRLARVLVG